MPAPGAFEASHQHLVGRLQEQGAHDRPAGPQLVHSGLEFLQLLHVPTDDQRHPVGRRARGGDQFGHLGDQRRRQVVDHEPAEVLQSGTRLRATRARHPGDDQELGHAHHCGPGLGDERAKALRPRCAPRFGCSYDGSQTSVHLATSGRQWVRRRPDGAGDR